MRLMPLFVSLLLFHSSAFAHDGGGLLTLAASIGGFAAIVVIIWSLARGPGKEKKSSKAFSVLGNAILAFFLLAFCYIAYYFVYAAMAKHNSMKSVSQTDAVIKLESYVCSTIYIRTTITFH
ncbi:hypothetical protein ACO0LD_03830 [Undibacterium sp. Ji83W]|uniref:hypothetical protein n=1 Tax=Undibacterium sp. Ji83W TaxID=3413043 RepID=UPI003BF0623B